MRELDNDQETRTEAEDIVEAMVELREPKEEDKARKIMRRD